MFDKNKFSEILKNINGTYISQRSFAKKSGINRTYISQYMNLKLNTPPKPEMLKKLANYSNGLTTYDELMEVCGYLTCVNNSDAKQDMYKEFEKIIMLHNFYPEELDIIKNYLLGNSSDPDYIVYFNQFQNMLYSLEDDKRQFLLDICPDFLLLVSKKIINKDIDLLDSDFSTKHSLSSPVYSKISAGQPDWAQGCLEGYLSIAPNLFGVENPEECFFLRMTGESMNKIIRNGGYALIRKQDSAQNGDIVLILVNNNDAVLRRFSIQNGLTVLEPMSSESTFTTQVYGKNSSIKILGLYIGKFEITN